MGSQLFESIERQDEEDIEDMNRQAEEEISDDGSEYSDTEDLRERKKQKRPLRTKRKPSSKDETATHKQSQKSRLKGKTTFDKEDVALFGGKDTFATKTWNSLTSEEQTATLKDMGKPMKKKMRQTLQSELVKVSHNTFRL